MQNSVQRILATALIPAVLVTSTSRADILAQWTFETAPPTGSGTANGPHTASFGVGSANGFHTSANTAWSNPVGNGSGESWSSDNWGESDYYQFQTSTVGFEGITLTWDQTRSGTGPSTFDLAWSVDGTNFTVFLDDYAVDAITWNGTLTNTGSNKLADLTTVLDLNNAANVYFRLVAAVAGSGTAGTNRVDNFTINGVTLTTTPEQQFWDTNGNAPGIGGAGTWTGTSATWNPVIGGTDPTVALDPAKQAAFGGTAGEVTIGSGAVANGGVEVTVDGYRFVGGSLALGGSIPLIKVTNETDTAEVAASISGTGGLRKTGAGRLILSADNSSTLTGTITIQEGSLEISADSQLGAAANPITLANGTLKTTASLVLNATRALSGVGGVDIAPGTTLTLGGQSGFGSLTLRNIGTLEFGATDPSTGALVFERAAKVTSTAGTLNVTGNVATTHPAGTAEIEPDLSLGNAARFFTVADGSAAVDLLLSGNITSSGTNGRLNKLGAGTLDLPGDTTGLIGGIALGNTTEPLAPGGTLRVHSDTALGGPAVPGGPVFFFNSGTLHAESALPLTFNNGVSFAAGRLENGATFTGAPMTFLGEASLFRPFNSSFQHRINFETDVTFAGGFNVASNPGTGSSTGVTITGSGTLSLPNINNSVDLPITVDGGHVSIAGSLTFAPITVVNGGILSGATNTGLEVGERIAVATIGAGGILDSGLSTDVTGTLHFFNFTLENGGTFLADLGGVGNGDYDQLSVSNDITLGGTLSLSLVAGYQPVAGDTFILVLNEGLNAVNGFFAGMADDTEFALFGTAFSVDYQGGDGNDVELTVIPEPGSCALLVAGALILSRRRRRH